MHNCTNKATVSLTCCRAWEYDLEDEEEITAEVILAQAKAAATGAAEMLTLRAPKSKVMLLAETLFQVVSLMTFILSFLDDSLFRIL